MKERHVIAAGFVTAALVFWNTLSLHAENNPAGIVNSEIEPVVYGCQEQLDYDVSWSGGIKIGELRLKVKKTKKDNESWTINAHVQDSGVFRLFYPVDDTFVTRVKGNHFLPSSYDVKQIEGHGYTAERHTEYDQKAGVVRYRKNQEKEELFHVSGVVHNEFSSLFYTRMLDFKGDGPLIVPTFADKKRHEVVVRTGVPFTIDSEIFGDIRVLPVTPEMKFKGLYDKDGDTVIFLSDDQYRIPVRISAKILIGSLVADLVFYSSSECRGEPGQLALDGL